MNKSVSRFPNGLKTHYVKSKDKTNDTYKENSVEEAIQMFEGLKTSFKSQKTKNIAWRKEQLIKLRNGILEMDQELVDSACQDFKTSTDAGLELVGCIDEIRYGLENLDKWSSKEYVEKSFVFAMDDLYIKKQPYGTVLIISPWNFPIRLSLLPLIGAILAGNCCILKPSELTPYTSSALHKLINTYLDTSCFGVLNGGPKLSSEILEFRWDFIFYTGGTNVGKIVQQAASKNLIPTVLELGGKNPVFIDGKSINLKVAARRIAFGKWMNAGQICLSPDYIICSSQYSDKLANYLIESVEAFYTKNPQKYEGFTRIVNKRHTQRIIDLLPKDSSNETILYGGNYDLETNYVSPTIVKINSISNSQLMNEESFSPILTIVEIEDLEDSIDFVSSKETPLALYIFSNDKKFINTCIESVPSGGVCVNDTIMHANVNTLPFGGLGYSGIGAYNGKATFDAFSHKRSILKRSNIEFLNAIRYEPLDFELGVPLIFPETLHPFRSTSFVARFFNWFIGGFRYNIVMTKFLFSYIIGKYRHRMS